MTGRLVQLQSKGKRHPSIAGEVALGKWLNAAY